jgi:hypothetical protein
VLDHLLSGGIESAPSCVPQFDAFSHQGHVSADSKLFLLAGNQPYAACGYRRLVSIYGT